MSRLVYPRLLAPLAALALSGCGGDNNPGAPVPVTQPAKAPSASPSPWEPDPGRATQLTLVGRFGTYQIMLPANFDPVTGDPPPGFDPAAPWVSIWRPKDAKPGESDGLIAFVDSDPKVAAEAKQPDNLLREMTRAAAEQAGASGSGVKQGTVETGTLAGIPFRRVNWSAYPSGPGGRTPGAGGFAYLATDGPAVVSIMTIARNPGTGKLLEAAVATLTRVGGRP